MNTATIPHRPAAAPQTRLGQIMAAEGRTAAWLARQTGVSKATASRLVRGERAPGFQEAFAVARALRRPVEDVFDLGGDDDLPPAA